MKYQHCFFVRAPVECVADFHRDSASMAAITPPPIRVRVHSQPERVEEGAVMAFTLWMGPLPIPWRAVFEKVTPLGFTDRLSSRPHGGPFRLWLHRHRFLPVDDGATLVVDEIQVVFRRHLWWGVVGRLMWWGMPVLFAYRGWKTRRLLESR
jgi:ligand-binding SRPBCC domain-containing protein